MAHARDERHRYGQHYTPAEVARLLAAFAVRTASDLVLDPSCGDGRLLREALTLKRKLSSPAKRASRENEVFGVDRSPVAIELAARTGARVAQADFFNIAPGQEVDERIILPRGFDAIIGNPPYIRQELMGAADKRRIQQRLALDRAALPDAHWPRWSGRSDIYVYFFAHSIRFLRQGGRLIFLTASSWLDAGYGTALREFLVNNFRIIAIVESAGENFFADASINTSITVLERESDSAAREANLVRFVRINRPLSEIVRADALSLAKVIERASSSLATPAYRIRIVDQKELTGACRGGSPWPPLTANARRLPGRRGHGGPPLHGASVGWGKHLRAEEVFFRIIERGIPHMRQLSQLARVRFGVKTGANEFFYVVGQSAHGGQHAPAHGSLRALTDVASVRRGLTTGANEFFYLTRDGNDDSTSPTPNPQPPTPAIESRYLSPVIFSLKAIPGIVLERAPESKLFFNCQASKHDLTGTGALCYIEHGERAGFHTRPTCASRDPWYAVAREMKPAPLIFPSKVGERWVVALNRARAFEDKKLYGIFPAKGVSKLVLAALLNSTWARYYAEVTCRQMTGAQAIADIDVAVAGQIMIPDPRDLPPVIKKKLEAAATKLARRPVYSVFEEVKRADRRRLDALTLEAIGFGKRTERENVVDELYGAVTDLVRIRLTK